MPAKKLTVADFYNYALVCELPVVEDNAYFQVRYVDDEFRLSTDKVIKGLVVIERNNGNYWIDVDCYNGLRRGRRRGGRNHNTETNAQ
jgi:hypothetical protein